MGSCILNELQRFAGELRCRLEWLVDSGDIRTKVERMSLNWRNGQRLKPFRFVVTPEFSHVRLLLALAAKAFKFRLIQTRNLPHVISLMVTPSPMDTTTTPGANSDLDIRISRIADPNIGMISILS